MSRTVVAAGAAVGVLYSLSPLTVLSVAMVAATVWYVARDMAPRERAWFVGVLTAAMGLRLIAIAALFLFADPSRPVATFFGDEELFKQRTVWLRNVFMDVPIAPADMIYVFDEVGRSSYIYLLAYIQALVGDAPYGLNVLNASWYVTAVVMLYAVVRRGFGKMPAFGGLLLLLFIPTLFSWSVSVLKEALYILLAAVELTCAVYIVRARRFWLRAAAAGAVVACAYALRSVRLGGELLALVGTGVGLGLAAVFTRPRLTAITVAAAPVVIVGLMLVPRVQDRVMAQLQLAAFNHWGHIATPGYSYRLLDDRFYAGDRRSVYTMTGTEAGRYVLRAVVGFITVPRPSQIESRAALAYLPEQALWYLILILTPIGVVAGWRRDPVLTGLLLAHALTAAVMVALTAGNIGTLTRHRGLVIPYVSWLAAVGACHVIALLTARHTTAPIAALSSGEHA